MILSPTSPSGITTGTTGLVVRLQRCDLSIRRVVQSNDFFYEERGAMMARVQLVAEGGEGAAHHRVGTWQCAGGGCGRTTCLCCAVSFVGRSLTAGRGSVGTMRHGGILMAGKY